MKLEVKALQVSLAIHALVLLLIIIFSKASLNAQRIVVIDLTLIDPVIAEAGVSGDKKVSDMYEPKTKHEKAVVEEVEPVIGQKKQESKEQKEETEVKVTQDHEGIQLDEQVPVFETVPMLQDTEKNHSPEDQEVNGHAVTFLAGSGETEERSLREAVESSGTAGNVFAGEAGYGGDMLRAGYTKENFFYVKDIVQRNIKYPEPARQKGWIGKVEVSFNISENGYVENIEVTKSSGHKVLDEDAIESVKRSSPFPKPPVAAKLKIPILYTLH